MKFEKISEGFIYDVSKSISGLIAEGPGVFLQMITN